MKKLLSFLLVVATVFTMAVTCLVVSNAADVGNIVYPFGTTYQQTVIQGKTMDIDFAVYIADNKANERLYVEIYSGTGTLDKAHFIGSAYKTPAQFNNGTGGFAVAWNTTGKALGPYTIVTFTAYLKDGNWYGYKDTRKETVVYVTNHENYQDGVYIFDIAFNKPVDNITVVAGEDDFRYVGPSPLNSTCKRTFTASSANSSMVEVDVYAGMLNIFPKAGQYGETEITVNMNGYKRTIHVNVCTTTSGHSFSDWKIIKPATCQSTGMEARSCQYCGYTLTREIPKSGHSWGAETFVSSNDYYDTFVHTCTKCTITEQVFVDHKNMPFDDLPKGKWYSDSVLFCYDNGFMAGTAGRVFSPFVVVTRAMFVQILSKMSGDDVSLYHDKKTFDDVPTSWYHDACEWAYDKKITSGTGSEDALNFNPTTQMTRQEMAVFLLAYAKYKGMNTSEVSNLTSYTDSNMIASWAYPGMAWCVKAGLISGTSGSTLSPRLSAERCQVACVINKLAEISKK